MLKSSRLKNKSVVGFFSFYFAFAILYFSLSLFKIKVPTPVLGAGFVVNCLFGIFASLSTFISLVDEKKASVAISKIFWGEFVVAVMFSFPYFFCGIPIDIR